MTISNVIKSLILYIPRFGVTLFLIILVSTNITVSALVSKIIWHAKIDYFYSYIIAIYYTCKSYRFDEKENVSSIQQLKSSIQKGIRTKLLEQYPLLDGYLDLILPKKDSFRIVKW